VSRIESWDRLAETAARGDRGALERLSSAIGPVVGLLCRAELGTDHPATDICHSVLVGLPRHDGTGGPFLRAVYQETARRLRRIHTSDSHLPAPVANLPGPQREVLVLRTICAFSIAETAAALGRTQGAVRVLQHRAITQLRTVAVAQSMPGA
jgi:RNA polymerase sigma-70 factor, ECF subfamily